LAENVSKRITVVLLRFPGRETRPARTAKSPNSGGLSDPVPQNWGLAVRARRVPRRKKRMRVREAPSRKERTKQRNKTGGTFQTPSDGDTEAEAIANVKTALESQLATGKIVTISLEEPVDTSIEQQHQWLNIANLDRPDRVVRDWQILSESSLAEVWLNEEEDKAWQDL
jgi:hypothetical protein